MANGYISGGSRVAGVAVRVLKIESHKLASTATQYPVESGKSISDHVTLQPNIVNIQCEMPNTDSGTEKARGVLAAFIQMRDSREKKSISTEHALYKNMVLTNVAPVHQAPYKGALRIDLTFQQVGIIGEKDMVTAQGGRDPGVLAGDGTESVACGGQNAGRQRCPSGTITEQRIARKIAADNARLFA